MTIEIREVKSKKELKTFIHLPALFHKDEPLWVPPVWMDETVYFDKKKNKSFSYCDTILLLAYRDNKPCGRIMGLINHRYNEIKQEKNGRFHCFEGYYDKKVAHILLAEIEKWSKEKGMDKLVGPFGFSDKDPQGFLYEGFDQLPVIASNYNKPEIIETMMKEGYSKEVDLFVYKVEVPETMPEIYTRVLDRVIKNKEFEIIEFKTRKELRPYIRPIFTLINGTFNEIYGFMPFELEEMDDFAKRYLAIIKSDFVKVIKKEGECIAFVIGMPDVSIGLQKSKGYVFPFGFIDILLSQKRTNRLVLLLGAIKPEFRGRGLDVLLGIKMVESAWKHGFKVIDSHHELEDNVLIRAEMEKMGGIPYKKFRVFQKSL